MRRLAERHPLALFVVLTFVPSWALWIGLGVLSRTGAYAADGRWLAAQVGVFAPGLAALAVASLVRPAVRRAATRIVVLLYVPAVVLGAAVAAHGFADLRRVEAPWTVAALALAVLAVAVLGRGDSRVAPWPLPAAPAALAARWAALTLVLPVGVLAAGWLLAGGEGPARTLPCELPFRELTVAAILPALGFNLVFGGSLGEEPGWRGFLLPELLRDRSPLAASLVVSFWWALWHAPIDWQQGFVTTGPGGLLARQIWTLPVTVLFTWVTVRAGGSVVPAIAFHTGLNAFPDFALVQPVRYEASTAFFFVASLVAALAVAIADPRMLLRPEARAAPGDDPDGRNGSPP